MVCEPGKNYILENCNGFLGVCGSACKKCKERNRERQECMKNAGNVPCKNNCASWFPGNFSLVAACQAGCDAGNNYTSMCDYLENYVGDQQTIALYGIDCDLGSGSGSQLVNKQKKDAITYTIIAIVIVVVLFTLYLMFF